MEYFLNQFQFYCQTCFNCSWIKIHYSSDLSSVLLLFKGRQNHFKSQLRQGKNLFRGKIHVTIYKHWSFLDGDQSEQQSWDERRLIDSLSSCGTNGVVETAVSTPKTSQELKSPHLGSMWLFHLKKKEKKKIKIHLKGVDICRPKETQRCNRLALNNQNKLFL